MKLIEFLQSSGLQDFLKLHILQFYLFIYVCDSVNLEVSQCLHEVGTLECSQYQPDHWEETVMRLIVF